MRGTILGFDVVAGEGVITSGEGTRIRFARASWKSPGEPTPGRQVDFDVQEDRAVDVFVVPGTGNPLNLEGQDPGKQATIFGAVSLVCGVLTFLLGPFGIVTVVVAVIFGLKGKAVGADLPDKTGYYLSIAGLVLSAIALLITLMAVAACVGVLGMAGGLASFR